MRAGRLKDRIDILDQQVTPDAQGGRATAWVLVATVSAEVRALGARESLQADALQSTVDHRVLVRYRTDLTTKHRIRKVPDGPTFEITAVRDLMQRRQWLELDCTELS